MKHTASFTHTCTHCPSQSTFSLATHAIKLFKRANERAQRIKRGFQSEWGSLHFSVSCLEKRHFRLYFKHQSRATDERGGEKWRQVRTGETELTVKRDLQRSLSPGWDITNSKHVAFPLVAVNTNTAVLAKGMLVIFSRDLQVCECRQADL